MKKQQRKQKKSRIGMYVEKMILIVAVCVFCFAAFQLGKIFFANYEEKEETNRLREIANVPEEEKELDVFHIDFDQLKKINPDIVGWIVVKDTDISYPIVQGRDNEYYLTHTYEKKENYAGSIFMDYTATPDFSDRNTFIYGHNLYHGTMFAELAYYADADATFFKEHPYIYLYTPDVNYKLQVFSGYVDKTTSDSYRMQFSGDEDFAAYLEMVRERSRYDSGVEVNSGDHIVTLYTCSYENGQNPTNTEVEYIDERYFIHAKVIKELD